MNWAGVAPMLVKLHRPPPEIRIFSAKRDACSISTTRKPRWPATDAAIMPAAPAPMTATSIIFFAYAVYVVARLRIRPNVFGQTVYIGFETRKLRIELTNKLQ